MLRLFAVSCSQFLTLDETSEFTFMLSNSDERAFCGVDTVSMGQLTLLKVF